MSADGGRAPVAEFDSKTIHRLPDVSEYIRSLTCHGPSAYVDNARVTMKALRVDDVVLPIVINEPGYENSDVCSPYSHYVSYTREELVRRHPRIPRAFFGAVMGVFGGALAHCKLDKVVYVNNWLLTTNPHVPLTSEQMVQITVFLQERYPDHAIVHRSVNPYLHGAHHDALLASGYRMVKSRVVYLIDPRDESVNRRSDLKKDLSLLRRTPYSIVESGRIADSDVPRMVALYRALYLDKHSELNPQMGRRFFSLTLREGLLEYKALRRDGRIDAVRSYYVNHGVVTGAFVGYDQSLPLKVGLFRQLFALLFLEARERGALLNWSAGIAGFKTQRGAFPVTEYDAVYDRHLPARRRLGWRLVGLEGRSWSSGL